ncbi:hypothetical protein BJ138DRAFT_1124064 [Hygrophoropsis aurantiaca]|uniref:Uncharacterized protein n=1 Tax=Hygrophoropsis aurantiaca TaxID=72124 RepID=A0ACB8AK39_9AGAM|nr:hypothetical protein BJ138DRAFT_1124064 [Hygrophoropsis aurantiaca]
MQYPIGDTKEGVEALTSPKKDVASPTLALTPLSMLDYRPGEDPCPISRLPNEMLLSIFQSMVKFWNGSDSGVKSPGAITLSHVSCHWRRLSTTTPTLWTIVPIAPSKVSNLDFFQEYLRRSADLPISIYLMPKTPSWSSICSGQSTLVYEPFIDALLPVSHRITRLSSIFSGGALSRLLDAVLTKSASSVPTHNIFGPLITLIVNVGSQLTTGQFHHLLVGSPTLVSLIFDNRAVDLRNLGRHMIYLPVLENITYIGSPTRRKPSDLFSVLHAPSARRLELNSIGLYHHQDVMQAFFEDGSPKFPAVQTLVLYSFSKVGTQARQQFISAFPRVSHLSIDSETLIQLKLHELHQLRSDPAGVAWSQITHLTLDYIGSHFPDDDDDGHLYSVDEITFSYVDLWLRARQAITKSSMCIRVTCAIGNGATREFSEHLADLRSFGDVRYVERRPNHDVVGFD